MEDSQDPDKGEAAPGDAAAMDGANDNPSQGGTKKVDLEQELLARNLGITSFVAPVGWLRVPVPPNSRNRSPLYELGVKVRTVPVEGQDEDEKKVQMLFYCMGDAKCRARSAMSPPQGALKITAVSMTTFFDHCTAIHGLKSAPKSARALCKELRSAIEHVNKSTTTGQIVDEARVDFFGESPRSKIINAADRRY
jgi:hypothetical protein